MTAPAWDSLAQFRSPSTAEEERPAPRASDCGEVAMQRLRHPFTVVAGRAPHTERR